MANISDFSSVMDAVTAETVTSKPSIASSESHSKVSRQMKADSRRLLKEIRNETDPEKVHLQVRQLLAVYQGTGLHPLNAIISLAAFPYKFEAAIEALFETMQKAVARLSIDPLAFWKSLHQGKGTAGRYWKRFDQTLARLICHRWLGSIQRGGEWNWNPMNIYTKLYASGVSLFASLCTLLPDTFKDTNPYSLLNSERRYFRNCNNLMGSCVVHRLAMIKATRVAGHHLPQELVNLIAEFLYNPSSLLRLLKLYTAKKPADANLDIMIGPQKCVLPALYLKGHRIKIALTDCRERSVERTQGGEGSIAPYRSEEMAGS